MRDQTDPSRRDMLRVMAAGGLGVAGVAGVALGGVVNPDRKRVLRMAHLTDVHLNGEKGSDRALAMCYRHAQEHGAELILNTGDSVMELNGASLSSAEAQWALWHRVTRAECSVEMIHTIGNHDCWGWDSAGSESGSRSRRGKQMVQQELELPGRYYRVDRAGWSFIVLDSIFGSYTGRLDEEQMEWLRGELKEIGADRPVVVLTHIPIISACGFFDGERFGKNGWTVPGSWMHEDAKALKDLFAGHRNVKLALSGHMHQVDRIDFQGVSYVCSGAVSANWWKGKYYACDYGYTMIDLFDDGSFELGYETYGWDGGRGE